MDMSQHKKTTLSYAPLLFLLLVALALRMYKLNASFWLDEMWTHQLATGTWRETAAEMPYPLIYVLARVSIATLGDTEAATRVPMLIAGLLAIPVMYAVGKQIGGRTYGFIAAAFLVLSPAHVFVSQEARYYSIMVLCAAVSLYIAGRALSQNQRLLWFAFALMLPVGLLDTPTILGFFFAVGFCATVAAAVRTSRSLRQRALDIVAIASGFAAGFVVYIGTLMAIHGVRFYESKYFFLNKEHPEISESKEYVLGLGQYLEFLEYAMFRYVDFPYAFPLMLVLLALGSAWLIYRARATAVVIIGVLVVAPLPHMLVPVKHFYVHSYFTFVLPSIFLLAGGACMGVSESMAAWIGRNRQETIARPMFRIGRQALALVLASLFIISEIVGLNFHYTYRQPADDWRAVGSRMATEIMPGDVVIHVSNPFEGNADAWKYTAKLCVEFYVHRFVQHGRALLPTLTHYGTQDAAEIRRLVSRHPTSTVWIIDSQRHRDRAFEAELSSSFPRVGTYQFLHLYCVPAPASNQVICGGMEGEDTSTVVEELTNNGAAEIISGEDAWHNNSMKLYSPTTGAAMARFRVAYPKLEFANSRFETWREGLPMGWHLLESVGAIESKISPARQTGGLKFLSGAHRIALAQDLPSHPALSRAALTITARISATRPDAIGIAVQYRAAGEPKRVESLQKTVGAVQAVTLNLEVDDTIDPNSLVLELFKVGDTDAEGAVEHIDLHYVSRGPLLNPTSTYTLSFMAKIEELIPTEESKTFDYPGFAMLSGGAGKGLMLFPLKGTHGWERYVAQFVPGQTPLAGVTQLYFRAGIWDGTGVCYIDNVMLTEGPSLRAFVQGTKPPHHVDPSLQTATKAN